MNGDAETKHGGKKEVRYTSYSKQPFDEVEHLVNADGQYLFCRYWKPAKEPVALVFHVHGYAEHCGRSDHFAELLKDLGVYSFSHDHVGHGESEGLKGHCMDYKIFTRDIWQHIDMMKSKFSDLPLFLYGHSMGGGLSVLMAQERPEFFKGVMLSAPFIKPSPDTATPFKVFMAKVAVRLVPKIRVAKLSESALSSDKDQIKQYLEDPLNDCEGMRAGFAMQFLRMADDMDKILRDIEWPFFAAHSEKDQICDVAGTKLLFELSKSKDKTLKLYDDVEHMLEHERPEFTEKYFEEVLKWIQDRI